MEGWAGLLRQSGHEGTAHCCLKRVLRPQALTRLLQIKKCARVKKKSKKGRTLPSSHLNREYREQPVVLVPTKYFSRYDPCARSFWLIAHYEYSTASLLFAPPPRSGK